MECPPYVLGFSPVPPQLRLFTTSALPAFTWSQVGAGPRARVYDDDDDDDVNVDTSGMTQEEKEEFKAQRKLKKINREKRKRSKLNDQFDVLCRMLQMGKATRVEKLAVLNQTIRVLYQLKAENARLKEQRFQMKELLAQRHKGMPVMDCLLPSKGKPESRAHGMRPTHLSTAQELERHNALNGKLFPPGIPPPTFPQEVWMNVYPKQHEMWMTQQGVGGVQGVGGGVKQEVAVKQTPTEDPMLSWSQFFQPPPRPSDLDFAFGSELSGHLGDGLPGNFTENFAMATHGEPPVCLSSSVLENFPEVDFKPGLLPKSDGVDSVDMFFANDDPNALSELLA